jgi:hypothetical protein
MYCIRNIQLSSFCSLMLAWVVLPNISLPSINLLTHLPTSATTAITANLGVWVLGPKHSSNDSRLFHANFCVWALLKMLWPMRMIWSNLSLLAYVALRHLESRSRHFYLFSISFLFTNFSIAYVSHAQHGLYPVADKTGQEGPKEEAPPPQPPRQPGLTTALEGARAHTQGEGGGAATPAATVVSATSSNCY